MVRGYHTRIASRSVLGKRRRLTSGGSRFKRRRTNTSRRTRTLTTKSGFGSALRFKSRRVPRRRWNSMLWNSTLQKAHYRSNAALDTTITTQAGTSSATISVLDAMDNGVAPFYTVAGGAQVLDQGSSVPLFKDDIIVRGGKMCLSFSNSSASVSVEIQAWLIKPAPRFTSVNLPSVVPAGWDPTLVSEFRNDVGTVKYSTKFLLEPGNISTIERRIPIQKIDQEAWADDGMRWKWIVLVRDFTNIVTAPVGVTSYFNLSFAGDAIGTT